MSKRLESTYSPGRTGAWLKIRCGKRQDFVVGGMTRPRNSRAGFGALLIGANNQDRGLVYAGRVGSGFDDAELASIEKALRRRSRETSPLADLKKGAEARGAL